ncbi:MAG: hypothetical protein U9O20_05015 [Patescibacteria group bacterium]|nr:hypothetical protein [Patescibacteria group bacterium]
MNKKIITIVSSIIFIALASVVVLGGYFHNKNNKEKLIRVFEERQEKQGSEKIDTSDWKTYRNKKFGFEMKYPENWIPFTRTYTNRNIDYIVFYNKNCTDEKNATEYESFEDCSDFVQIEISGSSSEDELNRRTSGNWSWIFLEKEEREKSSGCIDDGYPSRCCHDAIPLTFTSIPEVQSCMREYNGSNNYYYFSRDNNHYLSTIRYIDSDYIPSTEKEILESFKFTDQ